MLFQDVDGIEKARLVCPHILGWTRNDEPMVQFLQLEGYSKSGLEGGIGWRNLKVASIRRVIPQPDRDWRTSADYRPFGKHPITRVDVFASVGKPDNSKAAHAGS